MSTLKETGTAVVNKLVEQGKQWLADAASKFLPTLLGKRDDTKATSFFDNLRQKFQGLLEHGRNFSTAVFKKAMDKLKAVADKFHTTIGKLTSSKEAAAEVDAIVDEHNAVQKRFIGDLFQKAKDLASSLLSKAKSAASSLVSTVLQKGADLFVGKRAIDFSSTLQTLGGHLSNLFSPFKDIVSGVGTTLKGHFGNLVDTVKGHAVALGNKLKGHASDLADHGSKLLDHGKNALSAITEVVKDVLQQTVANAKPQLDGIAGTLSDAGKTAVNHFTGGSN